MRKLLSISFICLFLLPTYIVAQQKIYESYRYALYSNKVTQGKYEATAISANEMKSTYRTVANENCKRWVQLKFSINGKDNEMSAGVNHSLFLLPHNGVVASPVFRFGMQYRDIEKQTALGNCLEPNTKIIIRLDMNNVLQSFKEKGEYIFNNGEVIKAADFKAVYVAGNLRPLSWNFESLSEIKQFELKDPDGDGIYETSIVLNGYEPEGDVSWKLSTNLSAYPQLQTSSLLVDALYNKALEEMTKNIKSDGSFMVSPKFPDSWTRHTAYSIFMSLAAVAPETAKKTLLKQVNEDQMLMQDVGTGGSYPVSVDRVVWALAAWEIYQVTGDNEWLKNSFQIIKKTLETEFPNVNNTEKKLFYGESTFLDWREQSYPKWMQPKDIYFSHNLGTNALYYQVYRTASKMAKVLGENTEKFDEIANQTKQAVNQYFWMADKSFFGQYLYGQNFMNLSPRFETLGESLSILFDIAETAKQQQIIEKAPILDYGVPCFYPQIPDVGVYHNNAIRPYTNAVFTWAAAKVQNSKVVEQGLGTIFRAAALFQTNQEIFSADQGDYRETELSADRDLTSIAANLAMVYRVFMGMSFDDNQLIFKPFIPKNYAGAFKLTNFKYRNAKLSISINGFGSQVKSLSIDGKKQQNSIVPANLSGEHKVEITMANNDLGTSKINLVQNANSPKTPKVTLENQKLKWNKAEEGSKYVVYLNGEKFKELQTTELDLEVAKGYEEYQVMVIDTKGIQSFLSEPVSFGNYNIFLQAEEVGTNSSDQYKDFTGYGYIPTDIQTNSNIRFRIDIQISGRYAIDIRYANGRGEINLDKKCAIRTLQVDGADKGVIVLPQRGFQNWSWGYSNPVYVDLTTGSHTIQVVYNSFNQNMDKKINDALLDCLRLTLLKTK